MIKLRDQQLSAQALAQLARHQAAVDNEPTYAAQVEKSRKTWRPKNQAFDEIKAQLVAMCPSTHRCCYCEDARASDVEHFRPKSLYPEVAYVWENYLLACSACNSIAKGNRFAVFDADGVEHDVTRLQGGPIEKPIDGDPLLINPRYEDPLQFLRIDLLNTFHFLARPSLPEQQKRRAEYTLDLLQLNTRVELVAWRKQAYSAFIGWIDTYRRYQQDRPQQLDKHRDDLKQYNHIAVWEEMKRTYRDRGNKWDRLKARYERLAELDELFSAHPELIEISIIT